MNFSIKAPTVVIFLEGANGAVLRNVISTLLGAGRSIRVLAHAAVLTQGAVTRAHVLSSPAAI